MKNKLWALLVFPCISLMNPYTGVKNLIERQNGIQFEKGLTWEQAKSKAKEQNKYIFVDCFTTWCGPCKYMSQKIFTQEAVGNFFNSHFISIAVQMDRTQDDSEMVRQWYSDATEMKSKYSINAYPTFLFFSPDGQVVHRIVGSYQEQEFIEKAKESLIPEKQYYTLITKYKLHIGDSVFLRNALTTALSTYDKLNASEIGGYYLSSIKDSFARDNLSLLERTIHSSNDEIFQYFLHHITRINGAIGRENTVESDLSRLIAEEEVDPLFEKVDKPLFFTAIKRRLERRYPELDQELPRFIDGHLRSGVERTINGMIRNSERSPDWNTISNHLVKYFPDYNFNELLAEKKVQYYQKEKMWFFCEKASISLLVKYGDQLGPGKINDIVWENLFVHSSDYKVLRFALKWSKHTIDKDPEGYLYLDTYANLLYKMGDSKSAIYWEKLAISKAELYKFSDPESINDLLSNYEKMMKGEKTWGVDNSE